MGKKKASERSRAGKPGSAASAAANYVATHTVPTSAPGASGQAARPAASSGAAPAAAGPSGSQPGAVKTAGEPRVIKFRIEDLEVHCTIAVTAYLGPLDPYRIQVTLLVKDDSPHYERLGSYFAVVSTNLQNQPNPGKNRFYFKTWSENEGMMEKMVQEGAICVVDPRGISVNQFGSKAYLVELLWGEPDVDFQIPTPAELRKNAQEQADFMSQFKVFNLG